MELLKLSKFKLQLRSLIHDVQELKERERLATEQLSLRMQEQKESEEEFNWRVQQFEAEIGALMETRQKLERKVDYLQSDNSLLENKQKELKGAINSLLQSRECFINAYEESTSEMKRSIEARDRKIAMLSEKINSHLLLFDSIEKEALCVKQVVDNVQQTLAEKENTVVELKRKMEKVSSFENLFREKISVLESKVMDQGKELLVKNKTIQELEAHLKVAKTRVNCNSEIEELQRAVSAKEVVIENLVHEKKALQLEVRNLSSMLMKIQDTFITMHEQDRRIFYSALESQEGCATSRSVENNSTEDSAQQKRKNLPSNPSQRCSAEDPDLALCQEEHKSVSCPSKKNRSNCISESACSVFQTPSEAPCTTNDSEKILVWQQVGHLDSECSTTHTETSEHPGHRSH